MATQTMIRSRGLAGAALLLLAAGTAGCLGRKGVEPLAVGGRGANLVSLTVENQNFNDATIYALSRGGTRERLGVVPGQTTRSFRFRWPFDDLRIGVDLLAASSFATETLTVAPGDEFHLVIQAGAHRIRRLPG